ncbi:MAG: lysophospholipid acyltransferase family protein [Myxococcales bacterium]
MTLLFHLLAWPVALVLRLYGLLVRASCRLVVEGGEPPGPAVYVNWHRHLPYLVAHHGAARRWMMVSGAAYMAPIAAWCRVEGLHLVRGASGEGGRRALAALEEALRRGESVVLAVDGPAGPAFVAKPGCVELARRAGVPLVPVAVTATRALAPKGRWDGMAIPLPFGTIRLAVGAPVDCTTGGVEALCGRVAAALDALEPDRPRLPATEAGRGP